MFETIMRVFDFSIRVDDLTPVEWNIRSTLLWIFVPIIFLVLSFIIVRVYDEIVNFIKSCIKKNIEKKNRKVTYNVNDDDIFFLDIDGEIKYYKM